MVSPTASKRADVLVVGGGPVGLALAYQMARFGVSVYIIGLSLKRNKSSVLLMTLCREIPEIGSRQVWSGNNVVSQIV